ncbi:MAG: OB-fold nucleic acid binding domain-containing protein [Candidatus Paceibacterota bacterium]
MAGIKELRDERIKKIELLKSAGMNPYPASVPRDYSIAEVKNFFDKLITESEKKNISIAGRVIVVRGQGAILFVVLQDGVERLQAVLKKDSLDEDLFNLFVNTIDNGDLFQSLAHCLLLKEGSKAF